MLVQKINDTVVSDEKNAERTSGASYSKEGKTSSKSNENIHICGWFGAFCENIKYGFSIECDERRKALNIKIEKLLFLFS